MQRCSTAAAGAQRRTVLLGATASTLSVYGPHRHERLSTLMLVLPSNAARELQTYSGREVVGNRTAGETRDG
jgi:hypothetical protein